MPCYIVKIVMDKETTRRRDIFEQRMLDANEQFKDDIPARNAEFDRIIPLALTWIGDDEDGFAYDRVEEVIRRNDLYYGYTGTWDDWEKANEQ